MNELLKGILLLLLLAGGYLFLIAPNIRRRKMRVDPVFFRPYAHRGLHDAEKGIMENSLPAFSLAAEKGYGIELDVHLSRDGKLVVHHDASLLRLCGADAQIEEMTLAEIRGYRLGETQERIPTLTEVLSLVRGRVPLMVEIKSRRMGDTAARALMKQMEAYRGPWCVEAFDPLQLRWFKRNAPQVLRGQLAYDPAQAKTGGEKRGPVHFLAAHLVFNFLSRPDFVAYGHETDGNFSFRVMRCLFRPLLAAWTVRSIDDFKGLQAMYDLQIFEAFEP